MFIAVDFDGTCVTHEYPIVGRDIGAQPVLKKILKRGHQIILWTMRDQKELADAVRWFHHNEIKLFGVNTNPTQHKWTSSPKAYGNIYIDDAALGCPRIHPDEGRPYVNWRAVETLLEVMGVIE